MTMQYEEFAVESQTTDGTPLVLLSLPLDDDSLYQVHLVVMGIDQNSNHRASYVRDFRLRRHSGGVAELLGSLLNLLGDLVTNILWGGLSVTVSGNNLVVTVTGLAATTIDWSIDCELYEAT